MVAKKVTIKVVKSRYKIANKKTLFIQKNVEPKRTSAHVGDFLKKSLC